LYGLIFYWYNLRGIGPAIGNPPGDIGLIIDHNSGTKTENNTEFPLKIPQGFTISVYARNLSGARMIAFDFKNNHMWLSRTSQGIVSRLEERDGKIVATDVFKNLRNPHGIAFDPQDPTAIYIAEEHRVVKGSLDNSVPLQKLADLPTQGGGHFTRTIKLSPDDRLYVSIGSSCNVCRESDPRRAAIYVMNKDGSDFKQYAKGLRNAVFFTWNDLDGRMWATEMGRDLLGDNTPPEEINVIEQDKNYGWPNCYGNNIHDSNFDKNTYIRNPCMEPFETAPKVEMQAHSAPLGLDFMPEEGWPESMRHDLIVAFHGSWNRTQPTGYKLVRIKLDDKGNYEGTEDFISGWLTQSGALGRPVDVLIQPGGTMFVSDDKAGLVYKIVYNRE
jgi:glucose/arabinose dehydrogenase